MSNISTIRNLKDLYQFKFVDKLSPDQNNNSLVSSRIQLPSFNQTKSKYILANNVLPKKIKQKNQNSFSSKDSKQIQSQLNPQQQQPQISQLNIVNNPSFQSPPQSPANNLNHSQYATSRNSRRDYQSIFNNPSFRHIERSESKDKDKVLQISYQLQQQQQQQPLQQSQQQFPSQSTLSLQQQQQQLFLLQQQQQQKQLLKNQQREFLIKSERNSNSKNEFNQQDKYRGSPFENPSIQNSIINNSNSIINNNNFVNNTPQVKKPLSLSRQSRGGSGHLSQNQSKLEPSNNNNNQIQPQLQQLIIDHNDSQQRIEKSLDKLDRERPDSPGLFQMLNNPSMSRNQFNYHYVIGKGGFGKVWKVDMKKGKQLFAMKEMSKAKIITKRSVNSVMSERHLLSQLKHPFIVNMNFAFQDKDNLYLVMDLLTGGDLRFHVGKHRRFKEVQTKFFVACMMNALEYLHNHNVIHRDIKPENLVLDKDGYVRVTDLGIARIWKPENSQDTSGTPGYMAPEVMCRQNHGIAVDYFALGVIGYEFMMGRRPYLGRSRKEIRDQILAKQVQIKKHEIPEGWSIEAADFINRLIQRKPQHRLGTNGPIEVKNHPWLKTFPWQKLLNKEIESPFIPSSIDDNFDYRQQISVTGKDTNEELIQQNSLLLRKNSVQNLFSGYNYDGVTQKKQSIILGQGTGSTNTTHNTNTNTNYTHTDKSTAQLLQQHLEQQQQNNKLLQFFQQQQNQEIPYFAQNQF